MSDISPRRRLTGRAAIAGAFLAVPLTASICYADGVPPALIASVSAAEMEDAWQDEQGLQEELVEIEREFDEAEREMADAERELDEAEREIIEIEREIESGKIGRAEKRQIRINGKDWNQMSEAERAEAREEMRKVREQFAEGGELRREMAELRREFAEDGEMRRSIQLAVAEAREAEKMAPQVVISCKDEYSPVTSQTDANGKTTLFVCETAGDKLALRALKSARAAVAAEISLSPEERAEALRSIDAEMAELKKK